MQTKDSSRRHNRPCNHWEANSLWDDSDIRAGSPTKKQSCLSPYGVSVWCWEEGKETRVRSVPFLKKWATAGGGGGAGMLGVGQQLSWPRGAED